MRALGHTITRRVNLNFASSTRSFHRGGFTIESRQFVWTSFTSIVPPAISVFSTRVSKSPSVSTVTGCPLCLHPQEV